MLVITLLEDVTHCMLFNCLMLLLLHQTDVEIYFTEKDLTLTLAPFLLGFRLGLIGWSFCQNEFGVVEVES